MRAEIQELHAGLHEAILDRDFTTVRQIARETEEPELIAALLKVFDEVSAPEAAACLEQLPPELAASVLRQAPRALGAEILSAMDDEPRSSVARHLGSDDLARLLDDLPSDEAVDVLQDLDEEVVASVIDQLPVDSQRLVQDLIAYDEESAGGLMTTEFATVPADATVRQAIAHLRATAADIEDLNVVYVVDASGALVGMVTLRDLVMSDDNERVSALMERHARWIREHDDQEYVAQYMVAHELDAVPVVDGQGVLVGQITLDDAAEVMEQEASEDMRRLSGLRAEDRPFSPIWASLGRRLPWLLANIPLAAMASAVVYQFTETIAALPVVVGFLPLVGGLAGNAAGQTVTVHVRGLALGDVEPRDLWRCVGRQTALGLAVGLILGLIVGSMQLAWGQSLVIAAVAGAAMALNCGVACCVGAMLPILLKRVGLDPAMGANLVTTSITDASGYVLVLGLAAIALVLGLT